MLKLRRCGPLLVMLAACGGATEGGDDEVAAPPAAATSPPIGSPTPPGAPSPASPPSCEAGNYVADPGSWKRAGSNPAGYDMNAEPSLQYCAKAGAHMQSRASAADSTFGTFMDFTSVAPYRGKRVRLRAAVRGAGLTRWAGLWLRVDGRDGPIAFDSMQNRPAKVTEDFAPYEVVVEVAADASALAFGVVLSGRGEVWAKEIVIEVVN